MGNKVKNKRHNHLGGGLMVRAWDQKICFFCDFKFESCDY